jgi:hypothetical protein
VSSEWRRNRKRDNSTAVAAKELAAVAPCCRPWRVKNWWAAARHWQRSTTADGSANGADDRAALVLTHEEARPRSRTRSCTADHKRRRHVTGRKHGGTRSKVLFDTESGATTVDRYRGLPIASKSSTTVPCRWAYVQSNDVPTATWGTVELERRENHNAMGLAPEIPTECGTVTPRAQDARGGVGPRTIVPV